MLVGKFADAFGARHTRRGMLVAAAVAATGCLGSVGDGDDDTIDDGDAPREPTQPIEVVVGEQASEATVSMVGDHANRFGPQLVWVTTGGRVVWRNTDPDHGHDVASLPSRTPEAVSGWSTGLLEAGETYRRTFTEPGVYDYVCTPHASHMVGRVVVGRSDPEDEPALSASADALGGEEARAVFAVLDDRTRALLGDGSTDAGDEAECDCPD